MNKLPDHACISGLNRASKKRGIIWAVFGSCFGEDVRLTIRNTVLASFAPLLLAAALLLPSMPGRTSTLDAEVWLYSPGGGAYDAIGYTVGGGHVQDPEGNEVAVVDQFGNVYSLDGSLIGYVVQSA